MKGSSEEVPHLGEECIARARWPARSKISPPGHRLSILQLSRGLAVRGDADGGHVDGDMRYTRRKAVPPYGSAPTKQALARSVAGGRRLRPLLGGNEVAAPHSATT